jgi:hypothetical protein
LFVVGRSVGRSVGQLIGPHGYGDV